MACSSPPPTAPKCSPGQIKKSVESLIQEQPVVIFSKTTCPYCVKAKEIFAKMGQQYAVIELDEHPQGSEVASVLTDITRANTVPQVFVSGNWIGGGNDTVNMYKTGELEELLGCPARE